MKGQFDLTTLISHGSILSCHVIILSLNKTGSRTLVELVACL